MTLLCNLPIATLFCVCRERRQDAAVHDIKPYPALMPESPAYPDQEAFGDSAYMSKENVTELTRRGFLPMIHEKGYRNKPLTEEQKLFNKVKSNVRCRVEHVFGAMKMRMGNEILRSISFERAKFWIGMRNLMYNMSRFVSLKRSLNSGCETDEGARWWRNIWENGRSGEKKSATLSKVKTKLEKNC